MPGTFDLWTLAFAFAIAALAGFAAFEAASHTRYSNRPAFWVLLSGTTLGMGIWSMHFIGMLAWEPPFPLFYNLPRTVLSVLASVVACCFAMQITAMHKNGAPQRVLAVSAFLVGVGICAMHYIGMSAMTFSQPETYDMGWLLASFVIAVAASYAALLLLRASHQDLMDTRKQLGAAVVLGIAVCGMHCVAMRAMMLADGATCVWHPGDFSGIALARIGVGNAVLFIVALLLFSHHDRVRLLRRASEAQVDAHEAFRQVERLSTIGKIAFSVSHEINNPLDAAMNVLYLVEGTALDEEQRTLLTMAQGELHRIKEITQHTLNFYKHTSEPELTSLPDLFDSALVIFDRRLRKAGITVEKLWDDAVPAITCRAGEIRQVVANLLGNAVDALPQGGCLQLVLRPKQGGVEIEIADNGCGIDADKKARVLEPFFTTKGDRGTGLGLSISAEILQRHGGTIRFETSTEPGRTGTRFQLWLPSEMRPQPASVPARSVREGRSRRRWTRQPKRAAVAG